MLADVVEASDCHEFTYGGQLDDAVRMFDAARRRRDDLDGVLGDALRDVDCALGGCASMGRADPSRTRGRPARHARASGSMREAGSRSAGRAAHPSRVGARRRRGPASGAVAREVRGDLPRAAAAGDADHPAEGRRIPDRRVAAGPGPAVLRRRHPRAEGGAARRRIGADAGRVRDDASSPVRPALLPPLDARAAADAAHQAADRSLDVHHAIVPETARVHPDTAALFRAAVPVAGSTRRARSWRRPTWCCTARRTCSTTRSSRTGCATWSTSTQLLRHFGGDAAFLERARPARDADGPRAAAPLRVALELHGCSTRRYRPPHCAKLPGVRPAAFPARADGRARGTRIAANDGAALHAARAPAALPARTLAQNAGAVAGLAPDREGVSARAAGLNAEIVVLRTRQACPASRSTDFFTAVVPPTNNNNL